LPFYSRWGVVTSPVHPNNHRHPGLDPGSIFALALFYSLTYVGRGFLHNPDNKLDFHGVNTILIPEAKVELYIYILILINGGNEIIVGHDVD